MNTKELHSLMIAYIYGQKKRKLHQQIWRYKYDLEAISQIPKSAKPNSCLTQIKRLVKIFFIPHNILKEISLFIKRNKPMHIQITYGRAQTKSYQITCGTLAKTKPQCKTKQTIKPQH